MPHVLGYFGLILEFLKPSVVELSILRGVPGRLCQGEKKDSRITTPSLELLNMPVV